VAVAADKIIMPSNSLMMIHDPAIGNVIVGGNFSISKVSTEVSCLELLFQRRGAAASAMKTERKGGAPAKKAGSRKMACAERGCFLILPGGR
ncbi:hypothetical protein, partial [Allofournierella sp.]|uniref:hypothetical protein n=1 Tax=Allofournierella sp. TaxID=1940256 RepID=UPI003AB7D210